MEAAEGEGEFGVEIEGGGGESALAKWKLRGEEQLQGELRLSGAALGDDFGDALAGNAAAEEAVEDGAAESEGGGSGGERAAEEIFRLHFRNLNSFVAQIEMYLSFPPKLYSNPNLKS